MYTVINFKSKKELKEAVLAGKEVRLYAPGLGTPVDNGREFISGPHYPQPHKFYAEVRNALSTYNTVEAKNVNQYIQSAMIDITRA